MIVMPVYDGVDLLDVTGPYEMFHWAQLDVLLVAERAGPVTSNSGLALHVDKAFSDAPTGDVLWTPGGEPAVLSRLMRDPSRAYLNFLIAQSKTARYIASVCEGALLLAAAGLLDGYKVTTHWAVIPCLLQRFPNVVVADGYPRFHLDRNRLTGGGISSGLDEALELIRLLKGEEAARLVQQTTQYYPKPPVHSEIPATVTCPLDEIIA
ncbi:transcriptional regulator [Labrys miyagiensis]|uniref:Transcriptional regulator n=1 Tax=Labrys miyagiensis TaxID=346912 RepID=A0ABQ6CI46_9HYPH|nr:DJ-1/PfpI family protein [Labrys miyagiensis]GLS19918.1 transcriptional regulator [Labrys miyagiensis]